MSVIKSIIGDFVSKTDDVRRIWEIQQRHDVRFGRPSIDLETFVLAFIIVKQRLSESLAEPTKDHVARMEGSGTILRMAKHARAVYDVEKSASELFVTVFDVVEDTDAEEEVIVRIRGTDSLIDVVTDLAVATHATDDGFVHLGIFEAAQRLLKAVMPRLTELGARDGGRAVSVVGHSLGGGCAGLLGPMLRSEGINCEAYAFGPAACVSESMAGDAHVTSFINGADCVPRLTWMGIENLSDELAKVDWDLELLGPLSKSAEKWLIGGKVVEQLCRDQVARVCKKLEIAQEITPEEAPPALYPPGTTFHITDNGIEKRDIDYWQRLELSPRLLDDHFIDNYVDRLKELQ